MTNTEDRTAPRHRKDGRASKHGSAAAGRHLGVTPEPVTDLEPDHPSNGWPPGAYPVEDFAGMSVSAVAMLLHRATIESGPQAANCPHLLIARDSATGSATYSGPYPTGLEALRRAREFVDKHRGLEPRWDFSLTVAPLFPD